METLKFYVKKFFVLFPIIVLSLFFFIVGIIRTDKAIILKGDTVEFTSVVDVNTSYQARGSFSTIYVKNMEKSTVLQNWIANSRVDVETYTISTSVSHLNDLENYKAGKIQYNSSIGYALVLAYNEARKIDSSIHLDYKFVGFDITYYGKSSTVRIGDRLVGFYSIEEDKIIRPSGNGEEYRNYLQNHKNIEGDYFIFKRDNTEFNVEVNENEQFEAYGMYECNAISSTPTFTISSNMIGGPSGGLLQALSIYNQLVEEDLTHGLKIAGTGTINPEGVVGMIGAIKEKIPTAYDDKVDVFFVAKGNYEDAKIAYEKLPSKRMKLVEIESFYDALNYLKEGYKNDFGD